jgi:hypothetical protein
LLSTSSWNLRTSKLASFLPFCQFYIPFAQPFSSSCAGSISKSPDSATRSKLVHAMSTWSFKPYELTEEELYHCSCLIFEAALSIEGLHELEIDQGTFLPSCLSLQNLDPRDSDTDRECLDALQIKSTASFTLNVPSTTLTTPITTTAMPWTSSRPSTQCSSRLASRLL